MAIKITRRPRRKQKAVYWAKTGSGSDGQPTYAEPVEIKCRWEDVNLEILDAQGRTVISNARVYPDRETHVGGALLLGTLSGLAYQTTPFKNVKCFEILRFDNLPNSRAKKFLLTAYV